MRPGFFNIGFHYCVDRTIGYLQNRATTHIFYCRVNPTANTICNDRPIDEYDIDSSIFLANPACICSAINEKAGRNPHRYRNAFPCRPA